MNLESQVGDFQFNLEFWAMKVLLYLIGLGLCKGQNGNPRSQELNCYECASKQQNDTCTEEFRRSVKILGFDKRCRIMEMNGKVVSQGVVPKVLCTPSALAKVSDLFCLFQRMVLNELVHEMQSL